MGEKYNGWNADPAVRPFLEAYHLADSPVKLANALEVLVYGTTQVRKEYDMTTRLANELITEETGLKFERLRQLVDGMRQRTVFRFKEE